MKEISDEQWAALQERWAIAKVAKTALLARLAQLEPRGPQEVRRASGLAVCEACGLAFDRHLDLRDLPAFTVLCSGEVVKT